MVSDKENGEFTMEDELLLVQLGTFASLAIQHIEARLNIERKALEMETVFSTLTDAVMVLDESGTIVEFQSGFASSLRLRSCWYELRFNLFKER
jgi:hypothetical protein